MNRKFFRAGAIASVAVMFVMFLGSGMTGVVAQDQAESNQIENLAQNPLAAEAQAAQQPRFVSNPVVQEIPAEDAESASAVGGTPQNAASLRDLIAALPSEDAFTGDLQCLAQAVYFESRGEPITGQLAVARVVINRAASSQFPDDYCSVVTQRAQFSFVRSGRIPVPNTSTQAWRRARAIARIAHQDMWESEVDDSLYFHATSVNPRWARAKSSVARIDSHIFYR